MHYVVATTRLCWIFASLFTLGAVQAEGERNGDANCVAEQDASCTTCSDGTDLQRRIRKAVNPVDGSLTTTGERLRGSIDNVVSLEECQWLVDSLPLHVFVDGAGYENSNVNAVDGAPVAYAGLDLIRLASLFPTSDAYERFLHLRERVRARTEQALGLCPGTLKVHFTHVAQKTMDGQHRPHADNCVHTFAPSKMSTNADSNTAASLIAVCDDSQAHPYPQRVAASILYLNDPNEYGGGAFYFANRTHANGVPERVVPPKVGRLAFFTGGTESLHAAFPVHQVAAELDHTSASSSKTPVRRITLALWYVSEEKRSEKVPSWKAADTSETMDDTQPDSDATRLMTFPIQPLSLLRRHELRQAVGRHMVHAASSQLWQINQALDDATTSSGLSLYAIFHDHTAMLTVQLYEKLIAVDRYTDEAKGASLKYMLQESLLLHTLLDALEASVVGTNENDGTDRLVSLLHGTCIHEAREGLPARQSR